MFNYRILLLTMIGTFAMPALAMQDYLHHIIYAPRDADLETIKALDPNGENPASSVRSGGLTPLYVAAGHGHRAIVKYYVEKLEAQGKDINPALTSGIWLGLTPLYVAAINDHLDIVKIFVYRGAPHDIRNPHGKTVANSAHSCNKTKVAKYLQITAPLTQQFLRECDHVKMLLASITENREKLFKKPATDVRTTCNLCETSLIPEFQIQAGQVLERLKQLIQQGAEVNAQGKKGYSLLHCLVGYYDPERPTQFDEAVKEVVGRYQVNLDDVTDAGDTALCLAAKFGNSRIYKYLLTKGAEPRIGNNAILVALATNNRVLRHVFHHVLHNGSSPKKELSGIKGLATENGAVV